MPKFKVFDEFYKKEYVFEVWDLIDIIHRLRLEGKNTLFTIEELKLLDFLDRIDKPIRETKLEKINI